MTSTVPKNRRLKILCMHGWGTNKQFMQMQTEILRKDLDSIAEFIFVDGPYQIPRSFIADPKVLSNIKGKPYSWFQSQNTHKSVKNEDIVKQISRLKNIFEEASDHYDGALGFSQGSQTFQWLLWYQAKGLIDWPVIRNMKFFINFSADSFKINMKSLDYKRMSIPSLHFLSQQDFLFNRCIISPTLYENAEVIYHSFGHRFPVLGATDKHKVREFLRNNGFSDRKVKGIQAESRL